MKKNWKNEKVMTRKEFNRDYFVRYRHLNPSCGRVNFMVGYDMLRMLLMSQDLFENVLRRARFAAADKFVCRPFHGVEVTFYAH